MNIDASKLPAPIPYFEPVPLARARQRLVVDSGKGPADSRQQNLAYAARIKPAIQYAANGQTIESIEKGDMINIYA